MYWIENITQEFIENGKFPLNEVIQNSFYYPSCGFDGGVIKDCNTSGSNLKIISFIYCDYATGEQAFRNKQNTFLGYKILGTRNINHSELTPNGWQPQLPPNFNIDNYLRYKNCWQPFINWTIYERDYNHNKEHVPKRFSLLYIGGEGVATYQALYWTNKTFAKALAIIQPGFGFGLNWTDFTKKDGALSWVVNNNPYGKPDIIYYGGYGRGYGRCYDDDFEWEGYNKDRIIQPYYTNAGEVRIWKKQTQ